MILLDINVLIALADPEHEHHGKAEAFFLANHRAGWATCPLTENGFVRIVGHANYPKGPGSTGAASEVLKQLCAKEGHHFWPDDVSVRALFNLPVSKHLTDHYLLSLALYRQGRLVSFDRHIQAERIPGGDAAYLVI
jgi:toxin-antitoxin system PIN domain toxin